LGIVVKNRPKSKVADEIIEARKKGTEE